MALPDSSVEFALTPPPEAPADVRLPPLRGQADKSAKAAPAAPADAAALWEQPPEVVDLDSPDAPFATDAADDPANPLLADPKLLLFAAPKVVKPISRTAVAPAPVEPPAASPPRASISPPPLPPPAAQSSVVFGDAAPIAEIAADNERDETPAGASFESSTGLAASARPLPGLRGTAAFFASMTLHMAGLIAASLIMIGLPTRPAPHVLVVETGKEPDEPVDTFELSAEIAPAMRFDGSPLSAAAIASGEPVIGGAGSKLAIVADPMLDRGLVALADAAADLPLESSLAFAPAKERLVAAVPDGALGDSRALVDNYDQAFDRITQEILWMLAQGDVLVVWCFDQSESMKDDQQEIRDRVDRVYTELGLTSAARGERLASAVTSFGQGFLVHTPQPVHLPRELRAAIDNVPVDPSGKEMMCSAVLSSIGRFQEIARRQQRQMALILVTDESGEREDNIQYLEACIATANKAACRVYILGREAVFGYPYAHMRWTHPQTGRVHWLPIDRGPETAFVEQLQTDGFGRRYDSFNSGFGPYEQSRLARETGGIFFMLPSLETKLVRGEKRRYELEAMRAYKPELNARHELLVERDRSPLRSVIYKITGDLDPYRPEVARVMEVSFSFPPAGPEFLRAAAREQAKAKQYLAYLDQAARALESIRRHRDQEQSARWQANYDLMIAQVLAYTARTYEYGAALDRFIANPKEAPAMKPGQMQLAGWNMRQSRRTVGGEVSKAYIERSAQMFQQVIESHPGTPWAARAQWELERGFGFELHERYQYAGPRSTPPREPRPSNQPQIPIPKL